MALPTTPVPLSTNAWSFITSSNYATMRTALGVGTTDSPTFAGINPSSNLIVRGTISIGHGTLTTTNTNLTVGYQALHNLVTGNTGVVNAYNTAIGFQSLNSLLSGGSNIAVGGSTLRGILSGSFNTAVGLNAGYFTSASTIVSAANNSIFLGSVARPLSSHQTDQIVIGREAVGLGSNTTVIGNSTTTETRLGGASTHAITTYGTYSAAGANYERLSLKYDGSSAYIIGTEQQGTGGARPLRLRTNGVDRITILSGGDVGIGTTAPDVQLEVYSSITTGAKELLRLRRASALAGINGDGQQLRFITGSTGVFGSGFVLQHVSTGTDNITNSRNHLRLYDDGISIETSNTTKIFDVNTTLGTVAISNTLASYLHGEELYGKLYIGGTFLTASTNNVRAVRVASVATLSTGYAYACFDAAGSTAGTSNNDHIVGFQTRVRNGSSGTLNTLYGTFCKTGADAGTTTNAYGHFVDNSDGAGTIVNQYGLYVNTLTKGTTNNYAIFTNGSTPSVFGGPICVQGTTGLDIGFGKNAVATNTGVGVTTLSQNLTGANNTAVGFWAVRANTTGDFNTGIGRYALRDNTTATQNTAVGSNALMSTTTGFRNTAVGTSSQILNVTGEYNTTNGYLSLYNNVSGSNNIAIGNNAGTDASAAPNTNSANSIYIGTNTKALSSHQTYQIVIGNNAVGRGSNTTVIGNSITTETRLGGHGGTHAITSYGTFSNGGANYERLVLKTGVGSACIIGAERQGTGLARALQFQTDSSTRMTITSAGNISINTTDSTSRVTVSGGDIELTTVGAGIIMQDGGGNRRRITVNSSGVLVVSAPL